MRNEFAVGFSCCMIGSYNFWSFYWQNKLFMFNSSFYFLTFLFGLIFLYKGWKQGSPTMKNVDNHSKVINTIKKDSEAKLLSFVEEIKQDHPKYSKVSNQINKILKSQNSKYVLTKIYLIHNEEIKNKFKDYQAKISQSFKCQGMEGPANTNYNFHGTKKICSQNFCNGEYSSICPLCSIIRHGFKKKFAGKGSSTDLRFGSGIYFSPDLNKSVDYADSESKIFILMAKVVMGKVYYAKDSDSFLDEFTEIKYNSIYGDPRVTHDLKKPEICVFNDESSWPKYMLEFINVR